MDRAFFAVVCRIMLVFFYPTWENQTFAFWQLGENIRRKHPEILYLKKIESECNLNLISFGL